MKLVADVYRLLSFLVRCSRGVRHSRSITTWIIITGLAAGFSASAFMTVINSALKRLDSLSSSILWGFIGLCVSVPLTRTVSQVLLVKLSARSFFELRMRLSRQMLSVPLRHLEELGSHRLMAVLTEDIPVIITALTTLPTLCVDAAIVVGCLVYLGFLSWSLLLAVLMTMVLGIIAYQIPVSKSMHYFRLARDEADAMFRQYRAQVDGAKELKLHRGRREAFHSRLEFAINALQRHNVLGNTIAIAAANCGDLHFIFIGLMLFLAPRVLTIDAHVVIGYVLTVLFMRTPLAEMLNIVPGLGRGAIAVRKVELLGLSLASQASEEPLPDYDKQQQWRSVELVAVTHAYQRDGEKDFVLGPVDLVLHPGELVFIVGGNGSGKTTLAKLLTGLYVPDSGEVRLNGRPITAKNRDRYRQQFAAVFTDFYVFDDLLGLDRCAVEANVQDYLAKLQLDKKVSVERGVFSTIDLSHGQRKRLALLTAYLEDRSIYLFDEWAADQDPSFKDVFYHQLLPQLRMRGKTVVVITHDDRYYHLADRVLKLEEGKCVSTSCEFDLVAGGVPN
jgi:putative ATP-binding cassette transporter